VAPALLPGDGQSLQTTMDEISLRILSYLADHPGAHDTSEGIAQWWLLEREIREQTAAVERALAELAGEGWLAVARTPGSPPRYRLNPTRVEEIRSLLREGKA
jgi:hypothetical protein